MSSPLAIAAVTASLKDLLNDGLLDHDLSAIGSFAVTALPPDRVETGQQEPNQLNLFLYQVTPNIGWRNAGLPTLDSKGSRIGSAPLALDLHYLLTAYGSKDFNAEVLLGYAMSLLHENPVLTRDQIRIALGAPSPVDGALLPSPFGTLSAVDLADQVELIKISPVFLSTEDLSKLWTSMQARYRTTMAYVASVVLIDPRPGGRVAAPVLKQGKDDRGPFAVGAPAPVLSSVRSAAAEQLPAARLGDDVTITGTNLNDPASMTAIFENPQAKVTRTLPVTGGTSPSTVTAHLPSIGQDATAMQTWAPGVYAVSLQVAKPDLPAWSTNSVPIALAPVIGVDPLTAVPGNINLTVTCTPRLRAEQEAQVTLIFGTRQIVPGTITNPADPAKPTELTFALTTVAEGDYLVRLRVNGVDSLPIVISGSPVQFAFDPNQQVKVHP
jgi:hypothetical protein